MAVGGFPASSSLLKSRILIDPHLDFGCSSTAEQLHCCWGNLMPRKRPPPSHNRMVDADESTDLNQRGS